MTFVMALLLTSPPGDVDQEAREILDRAKQAAGGQAWDTITSVHTRMLFNTGGLDGTAESWEDVLTGRIRSDFQLGPITGGNGFDGKISWNRDSSGQVLKEEGDNERERAANGAYRSSLAYWYPERWPAMTEYSGKKEEEGKSYHVVRITPDGGRPFDLWIDLESWLVNRVVEKSAVETRTDFFSDYRHVEGVTYPFASRSTNGETQYDMFTNVESIELNTKIDEQLFSMPAPPPPDFVFADGKTETTLPFRLFNNHMYLEVKFNGRGPYLILCDTGGANIITPTLAAELSLEPEGKIQGRGAGEESEDISVVKLDSLTVGNVTLRDQVFFVFPLESFSDVEGVPQSGLIGYEVFKRFVVRIDYENCLVTLTKPDAFEYDGNGTVVPFIFSGRIPQVEGSIDGIPGKFDIDTGSRASLMLMGPFVEKHGLTERFSPEVEGVTGWGVGGAVRAQVTRAKVLKLGDIEFKSPVTELSLQTGGAFTDTYTAGNVGAGLLKRYNIIFDYGNQEMIFEANAHVLEPDVFDRSGMWLNQTDSAFQVVDVIADGPAEAVGVHVGDTIVAVDGQRAEKISLHGLRKRFRTEPPGTSVRMKVKSSEGEREVILVLEDLV
jgi:hypothetical protein